MSSSRSATSWTGSGQKSPPARKPPSSPVPKHNLSHKTTGPAIFANSAPFHKLYVINCPSGRRPDDHRREGMSTDGAPSKPGSATAAATPPGAVSGSPAPSGVRSITRTSCSSQDKMIGRSVGKARILKRLGRGGMGDVYLCQHPDYDKAVAIKILPPDLTRNEELLQRFRREAESAARLDHPNLVEIYDVGEENGFHYILMAFVDGVNLQEHLDDQGKLECREAARIAFEVARGLRAVHGDGIIHR